MQLFILVKFSKKLKSLEPSLPGSAKLCFGAGYVLVYQNLCLNHLQIMANLTVLFLQKKTCTKESPRDTITLEELQIKTTTEVDRGL